MATNLAKNGNCDGVISIGGGSARFGKVVAALTNLGQIVDGSPTTVFHEVVGKGQNIKLILQLWLCQLRLELVWCC